MIILLFFLSALLQTIVRVVLMVSLFEHLRIFVFFLVLYNLMVSALSKI